MLLFPSPTNEQALPRGEARVAESLRQEKPDFPPQDSRRFKSLFGSSLKPKKICGTGIESPRPTDPNKGLHEGRKCRGKVTRRLFTSYSHPATLGWLGGTKNLKNPASIPQDKSQKIEQKCPKDRQFFLDRPLRLPAPRECEIRNEECEMGPLRGQVPRSARVAFLGSGGHLARRSGRPAWTNFFARFAGI